MSKTPFEVRLDVLKMAQEMLDKEAARAQDVFLAQVQSLTIDRNYDVLSFVAANAPQTYTVEDVRTRASSLYSFVNDKTAK